MDKWCKKWHANKKILIKKKFAFTHKLFFLYFFLFFHFMPFKKSWTLKTPTNNVSLNFSLNYFKFFWGGKIKKWKVIIWHLNFLMQPQFYAIGLNKIVIIILFFRFFVTNKCLHSWLCYALFFRSWRNSNSLKYPFQFYAYR